MAVLLQVIINGILFGTMYGIAAIGLSLIFGTMHIVFLAQGSVIVLFAYLTYWLFTLLGIDPYISLIICVPVAFIFGMGLFYGLFKDAAAAEDKNVSLLLAIGLLYLIDNAVLKLFTADPRFVATSYSSFTFSLGSINISFVRLMALVIALAAAAVIFVFLKKTRLGTAVRAASENMKAATLLGISPNWVMAVAFSVGIAFAGTAGVVMATVYSFDPAFGFTFAIKALIALALGGVGNVWGALTAGLLLGLIESVATFYVGAGWSDAISYGVFIVVLMFLPYGLFGSRGVVKKV